MKTHLLAAIAFTAMASLAAPAQAAVNLVSNGSFETGVDPGTFTTLGTGSPNISNWTVTGSIDYIGTYWVASNGSRSIDLNGSYQAGQVSQTVSGLTAGHSYTVSFDLAGNPDGAPLTKSLDVIIGGVLKNYTFPLGGATHANLGWVGHSFNFTATSSSELLSFGPNGDAGGAFGPVLDNVSVSAAVPEPSTWAMMLIGFGGLAMMARRRRRALAA